MEGKILEIFLHPRPSSANYSPFLLVSGVSLLLFILFNFFLLFSLRFFYFYLLDFHFLVLQRSESSGYQRLSVVYLFLLFHTFSFGKVQSRGKTIYAHWFWYPWNF